MLSAVSIPAASRSALAALRSVNRELETTQMRLATGKKVNSAADNPAVWSMAKGMESENRTSSTIRTGLEVAASRATNASATLGKVADLLSDMRAKIVAATAPGADTAALNADVEAIQGSLKALVSGAKMGGENWLSDGTAKQVVIGQDSTGLLVSSVDLATTKMVGGGTGLLESAVSSGGVAVLDMTAASHASLADLDTVMDRVKSAASSLGSAASRWESQGAFLKVIEGIRSESISDLVDADMDEETARLAALQVRQELASTALQIANASMRNILRLFQ